MATHYDTLGVNRGSTPEEIRRAYHVQARRWHPDRSADRSPAEARRAEDAMRRVNEAWRILGDDRRRRDYDRRLAGGEPVTAGRAAAGGNTATGGPSASPPRIDPRLLDPEYLAARRNAQADHIERGHAAVLRSLPWIAVLGLLVAIVIFSAYQGGPDDGTTLPVDQSGSGSGVATGTEDAPDLPSIGVPADACVRVLTGPSLQEVPCSGPNDGSVIAVALDPEVGCPGGSPRKVELRNGAVVCLSPPAS